MRICGFCVVHVSVLPQSEEFPFAVVLRGSAHLRLTLRLRPVFPPAATRPPPHSRIYSPYSISRQITHTHTAPQPLAYPVLIPRHRTPHRERNDRTSGGAPKHRYHHPHTVRNWPIAHSMQSDILTGLCSRHVLDDQFRLGPAATGDLTLLLSAIQTTSKFIATNVRRARLINL